MSKKQTRAPEGLEARYEKYRGILKDLTIMSDMFMRNVFKKAGMYGICPSGSSGQKGSQGDRSGLAKGL